MSARYFPDLEQPFVTVGDGSVRRKLRAHGPSLMMVEVFFEAGGSAPEHAHPHEQATVCLEGRFEFAAEGRSLAMGPGDSIHVPGGVPHSVRCLERGRMLDAFTPPREDFLN
ncbi:MAG: cupin domain-containing protein [Spirochaetales bacterium]|nr:cupin domain-containing protein [Spirochaetales bacterium]